ncbi:MAG: hypothetical protein KKE71_02465 [Nanoarchaeota archaeon]|nr:hypothetical protein [Nanoarchaeota archaeon]
MKFSGILLSLFITATLFSIPVLSEEIASTLNVSILSEKDAIFPGECNKYIATVDNHGGMQRVDFIIEGTRLAWITLGDAYYDFNNSGSKNVMFYLCPPIGTPSATHNFVFNARDRINNRTTSQPFAMYIMDRPYLELRDVTTSKDNYKIGEDVDFSVNVRNLGLSDAKRIKILAEISGQGAPEKQRLEIPLIEAERGASATGKFEFDRFEARGNYVITGSIVDDIGDVLYTKTKNVRIEEKSEVKKDTAVKSNALSKEVVMSEINTGNKKETVVFESRGLSYLALYSFNRQPDSIEYSGAHKIFRWTCDLAPATSCSVSYVVEYWLFLVIIIAALGITYVVYSIVEQPEIKKKLVRVHEREHTVHIIIKNRSRKALREVHVVDVIPDIVSVVPNSFSPSIKPIAKGKRGGTEIVWTFAKLEPKEERVLTYKIRPLVMLMGNVRLPKARIYAVDALGKKYRAESAVMVD